MYSNFNASTSLSMTSFRAPTRPNVPFGTGGQGCSGGGRKPCLPTGGHSATPPVSGVQLTIVVRLLGR